MLNVTDPGTIDDLVADAARTGHQVTVRLIRDWTAAGLLDAPHKRPAGKGHGSRPALYPAAQRELFVTLLHHRPGNGIKSLARIPVGIWMYWGEDFVPLRQVRRALTTWLGDPRVSKRRAKETARAILGQLDNPNATPAARRELLDTVTELAYTARPDFERLERVVRAVFEAGYGSLNRAIGHPAALVTVDSMIDLARARLTAVTLLAKGAVTDQDLRDARHAHLVAYADYAVQQRLLAASTPADGPVIYEPATLEAALLNCCGHLLTTLGLQHLYPEQAARIKPIREPQIRFTLH